MLAYHATDAESCAGDVSKVWKATWALLESSEASTRRAAAQALDSVAQCFTPSLIAAAAKEKDQAEPKSAIGKIISQTGKALDSIAFARSIPEVLAVIASLITNLRYRSGGRDSPTAAELLLSSLIVKVGELRFTTPPSAILRPIATMRSNATFLAFSEGSLVPNTASGIIESIKCRCARGI